MTKSPNLRNTKAAPVVLAASPTSVRPNSTSSVKLDAVMLGEADATTTLGILHEALTQETHTPGQVYDAVRALAWKKFAEKIVGEEMRAWHDIFRRVAGLLNVSGSVELGFRVTAFADLAIESVRFGRANSVGAMQKRAHVRDILLALSKRGDTAYRSVIKSETKLGEANLSRIIAHMSAAGFVERSIHGRSVQLSLTSLGREAIANPPRQGANALTVFPPFENVEDTTAVSSGGR